MPKKYASKRNIGRVKRAHLEAYLNTYSALIFFFIAQLHTF